MKETLQKLGMNDVDKAIKVIIKAGKEVVFNNFHDLDFSSEVLGTRRRLCMEAYEPDPSSMLKILETDGPELFISALVLMMKKKDKKELDHFFSKPSNVKKAKSVANNMLKTYAKKGEIYETSSNRVF